MERVLRTRGLLLVALIALMPMGCASGGGSGDEEAIYRESLGRVLGRTMERAREIIWQKHNIIPERTEYDSTQLFVQSIWLMREAEPPEQALGAIQARNRVTLQGRSIERMMDLSDQVYSMRYQVENEVQLESGEWVRAPMPPQAREFFREVYSDLRLEVNTGVRR